MGIADDIKKILEIKIKPRQDSYSDQFSRILLLKVMFVGALFTGLNWGDNIKCIMPKVNGADGEFVASSCWINGVYVYENIRYHNDMIGYYGMPRDISNDGIYANGELCETDQSVTNVKKVPNPDCKPMEKTFFLHYQYITFFLVLVGGLYYAPYIFFKYVNTDIQSLKETIKGGKAEEIYESFFDRDINKQNSTSYRVVGNVLTKILYLIVNVVAFVLTDQLLHGKFRSYGSEYGKWTKLNNTLAYDYMGRRQSPKPGNVLFPAFAFCEVYELAEDIKTSYINKHRFVCEMSQHILYQYIFIIIWWAMVLGIVVAVMGLILLIVDYAFTFVNVKKNIPGYSYMGLTIRECEYLSYLQRKKLSLFGDVIELLKDNRNNGLQRPPAQQPFFRGQRNDDVY